MEPNSLTHIVSLSSDSLVVLDTKIEGDALASHDLIMMCDTKPLAPETDLGQLHKSKPTRCYQTILLLSGFLMIFQVNGINSIFGVFQEYYTSDASNIPDAKGQDALVSLVGAIGYGLTYGGGIFVNQLVMRVENIKFVTLFGAVITSLGLFLAGFCTKLWQLYASQAFLFGFGATFLYFPIISITPRFFDRNRGFAMGFVLAGNGVGGLVLSPTTQLLIEHVGIRWTLRILALVTLLIMTPVAFALRQAPGFEERRSQRTKIKTRALFKKPYFCVQAIGTALQAAGNIIPLFYLNRYAISVLGYSGSSASILLATNNVANSISRVLMGIVADRVGRQNTLIASVFMSAIAVLTLWYDATRPRFVAFVITYGIFAGGYNALLPTTIAELYGNESYDKVSGMIYFLRGVGTLIGPPTAGALLGARSRTVSLPNGSEDHVLRPVKGKYDELAIYTGLLLLCASFCACGVRWGETRVKGIWKWKA